MPFDPNRVQALFLEAVERRESAARAALLDRECSTTPSYDDGSSALEGRRTAFSPPRSTHRRARQQRLRFLVSDGLEGDGGRILRSRLNRGGPDERSPTPSSTVPVAARTAIPPRLAAIGSSNGWARWVRQVYLARRRPRPPGRHQDSEPGTDDPRRGSESVSRRSPNPRQARPSRILCRSSMSEPRRTDSTLSCRSSSEGSDLKARIEQGRPIWRDSAELIATIADALQYAHSRGLVHRDIKPANILIDASGKPCLADFGSPSRTTTSARVRSWRARPSA